jgi:hypothetical protein
VGSLVGDVARLRRTVALLLIALAAVTGTVGALSLVGGERRLSVGTIAIGFSPFHDGALDVYVPLVDWGARSSGVRLPARLTIEVARSTAAPPRRSPAATSSTPTTSGPRRATRSPRT